jgi:hypothetical protein
MVEKLSVEIILQKIANMILLNVGRVNNVGLLDGKAGIALFLCRYTKTSGNNNCDDFVYDLLDEVISSLPHINSTNFANGLTGIVWGIDYLIKNEFVKADTDMLDGIDVFLNKINHPDMISDINSNIPFFSKGLYYIERDCKSAFLETAFFELKSFLIQNRGTLPLNYLNSILHCILKSLHKGIKPEFHIEMLHVLYENLADSIEKKYYSNADISVLTNNIEQLSQIPNMDIGKKQWLTIPASTESSNINEIVKGSIYNLIYGKARNRLVVRDVFQNMDIVKQVKNTVENFNYKNLGLYGGLAGIGLALIDSVSEK